MAWAQFAAAAAKEYASKDRDDDAYQRGESRPTYATDGGTSGGLFGIRGAPIGIGSGTAESDLTGGNLRTGEKVFVFGSAADSGARFDRTTLITAGVVALGLAWIFWSR